MTLKYRVLFWHTCGHVSKPFKDMLFTEMVEVDGEMKEYTFIDFNEHPFPEVIAALKGLNLDDRSSNVPSWSCFCDILPSSRIEEDRIQL